MIVQLVFYQSITEGSISLYDVRDGTITANESARSTDLMYGIKGLKESNIY